MALFRARESSPKPRVAVVVPVYNEEATLRSRRGVLAPLRKWLRADPENRSVVFVNDGSRDNTEELVRRGGFDLIHSSRRQRNVGKGRAFIAGVKHARNLGADVLVVIDADYVNVSPRRLDRLVAPLFSPRDPRDAASTPPRMAVASFIEGPRRREIIGVSGARAFRLSAFQPLWEDTPRSRRFKWLLSQGYGLESGLNTLFSGGVAANASFRADRGVRNAKGQRAQITSTTNFEEKRDGLARDARKRRRALPSGSGRRQARSELAAWLASAKARRKLF